ncbi:MAG: nucleotidyltransferase domain-containing protein [Burkholderiaceae bacterium]
MDNLPKEVQQSLDIYVNSAKEAFGNDLVSIVLFGSAATGELRATSDVNLLLVLKRFQQDSADRMREPTRLAYAAIELNAMFLLEHEVAAAVDAFAVKFSDIISRHRVLVGVDPFANLSVSRDALLRRVKQVLLNLQLRLRERYVALSLREEQLAHLIADAAPPLRSSAASILQLEGHGELPAKLALQRIIDELAKPELIDAVNNMSIARNDGKLAPGVSVPTLMALIQLTQCLRDRVERA